MLQEHDKKMTAFMDEFPAAMEEHERQQRELQATILSLLQHVSKTVQDREAMPRCGGRRAPRTAGQGRRR